MGIAHLFPERQIIVRTAEGVRYIRLSPLRQKLYAGCAVLALASVAATSVANVTVARLADLQLDEIATLRGVYERFFGAPTEGASTTVSEESGPATESIATPAPVATAAATSTPAVSAPAPDRLAELERRLTESEAERKRLSQERDRVEAERQRLAASASAAEKRASALAAQQEAIQELIKRAKAALERSSRNVSQLGIEPERFLAAAPRGARGAGGPFIDARRVARGHPAQAELVELGNKLNKLSELQHAMRALPVGKPLPDYQLASPFGLRKDPFNGNLAMHNGLDLAAPSGTEIRVRAAGKVVYAGRNGVYGNMVEVDHGFGVRTRYGHLSQISVRQGQAVVPRDRLGLVGSTGRSTSPHLHYEVLFNGKTMDPRKFVEARPHVFQN
jgi:murein DD-endopeptidase MepM/ murein hydrolase activator NlpD